ncbi:hypothetical protein GCM10007913_16290 [Devosia yakushimensis]|uniref:Uncharacterized protein n=1 Tax=Devosia yakushimensis TaxID=470028 RepID=A0ABQ5UC68_9HYPH|nr:hypothetical protein GCM10007913_16290 [Devosia yakushimensis]
MGARGFRMCRQSSAGDQPGHPARGRSNLSRQVSGWRARARFHSCGGSAGLGPKARTGFPIITRPCDPRDHDTPYVVFLIVIHVKGLFGELMLADC